MEGSQDVREVYHAQGTSDQCDQGIIDLICSLTSRSLTFFPETFLSNFKVFETSKGIPGISRDWVENHKVNLIGQLHVLYQLHNQ